MTKQEKKRFRIFILLEAIGIIIFATMVFTHAGTQTPNPPQTVMFLGMSGIFAVIGLWLLLGLIMVGIGLSVFLGFR